MTALAHEAEKFISLGHPSYVWRRGQDRRLDLIRRYVPLEGRRILDIGCGIGTYVTKLLQFSDEVFGVDIDEHKVEIAARSLSNIAHAPAECLPYPDNYFDVILLNEVIEHVESDRNTIHEAYRCLRPGGSIIIFAPNRLYLFETHGFFLGKRFVFRLLPLVNYTPDVIRNVFCHHVRIYTQRGVRRLFAKLDVDFVVCSHIFPGFDNIAARHHRLGKTMQRVTDIIERTPLRAFGISHFMVIRKRPAA